MNKILVITSNIAPYRLRWEEELAKYFDVTIAYTKDREKDRDEKFLKHQSEICHIHKLNNPKDKDDPICFDVISLLKENMDSFVLFDGYGLKTNILGMLYYKLKGKRRFVNVDGFALGEKENKLKDIVKKFIIKNLCTDFFCSSEVTKKHLIEYGGKEDRIYVHNFSSISRDRIIEKPLKKEEKLKIRKQLGIDSNKKIVLGVGQFIPRKRFEDLIIAVKNCKTDCDLYILGGKATKEYLELVGDNKNIHFLDFVAPEDVDKYYLMADLFVLSSQTDVWGLVLNEAMANGLPVISSDNCIAGLSMIDGNGIIYKTGDIDELIKAIDYCLIDENNLKMSLKSLEIIKDYCIESMVDKQLPIINKYFENI